MTQTAEPQQDVCPLNTESYIRKKTRETQRFFILLLQIHFQQLSLAIYETSQALFADGSLTLKIKKVPTQKNKNKVSHFDNTHSLTKTTTKTPKSLIIRQCIFISPLQTKINTLWINNVTSVVKKKKNLVIKIPFLTYGVFFIIL